MKFKFHLQILVGIILLGLAACQKDKEYLQTDLKINDSYSVDEVRTVFAQTLSKALTDVQLRRYIHARMQEAYDTDYELVYIAEKSKIIYEGKTFADLLKSFAAPSVLERFGDNFFMTITDVSPLLSIKMSEKRGVDVNAWDVDQFIPVVPVLNEPKGTWLLFENGQKQEQPIRFRNEDEDYYDDEDSDFDGPVIGIWDAEGYYLISMDGKTSWGKHIEDYMPGVSGQKSLCLPLLQAALSALGAYDISGEVHYLMQHNELIELYMDCLSLTGGGGGSEPCIEVCARDCETNDETLVDFKINGIDVFRNIKNQAQQFESGFVFHADVIGISRNSLTGTVGPYTLKMVTKQYKRRDLLQCPFLQPCVGRWVSINYRIGLDWDQETFGSPYKIAWAEVDPGTGTVSTTAELSAKFKVGTVETTATATAEVSYTGSAIVLLGEQNVFYCDPIKKENSTVSVTFRCD